MKKILASYIIVSLFWSWFPINQVLAYNQDTLSAYLGDHNTSPWSVMALKSLGSSNIEANHLKNVNSNEAIAYTAPILAITALGQNPRSFGQTDYVAALNNFYTQGQIGDPNLLNDDIFGLLALISAGENAESTIINDLKNSINTHQNNDGGWGFMIDSSSDTNITAAALLALKASGSSVNQGTQNALDYLRSKQNNDGGFSYDGTGASDAASTAWVLWSLNAWQIDQNTWTKENNTARQFLEGLQNDAGYFSYQAGEEANNFTPITSSYAAIALAGKYLPINIISNSTEIAEFDFRIEGSDHTVCQGKAQGPTALDLVKNASQLCNFSYHITDTSYGPYLDKIGTDQASGMDGWMYLVNYQSPSVGAAEYQLQGNDSVLWYFGAFDWQLSQVLLSSAQINSGQSVTVTVNFLQGNQWLPLPEASIIYGTQTVNSNAQGQAQISAPDGYYKIYAEKNGYIRSEKQLLKIGQVSGANVSLKVTVSQQGDVLPPNDLISFVVEPGNVDFGYLKAGQSKQQNITIRNNGTNNLQIESTVNGDSLFLNNLTINSQPWSLFATPVASGQNISLPIKITIPNNYQNIGEKTGEITFWSTNIQ